MGILDNFVDLNNKKTILNDENRRLNNEMGVINVIRDTTSDEYILKVKNLGNIKVEEPIDEFLIEESVDLS